MSSLYTRLYPASEKAIEQASRFIGAPTWGDGKTPNIYAQVADDVSVVVAIDRGSLGVRFSIPECNTAMVYHKSKC